MGKYFLLAVLMSYYYGVVCSHFVTSTHLEPGDLNACIRSLANLMKTMYRCTDRSKPSLPEFYSRHSWIPRETSTWEYTLSTCCTRPCTVPELLAACYD